MDEELCRTCNGSGEGLHDGSRCSSCKGAGTESSADDAYEAECAKADWLNDQARERDADREYEERGTP
jgi:DnaJ-class molecular chaperone